MSLMTIVEQKPQWRANYDIGYVGFTVTRDRLIAAGINYFTKFDDLPHTPHPTHCFVITGEDETVEAFARGVDRGTLSDYLKNPDVAVLIRRPRHYTRAMGQRMADEASRRVGKKYGYWLVATLAVSNSFAGRLLSAATGGWFGRFVTKLGDKKSEEMCSETVGGVMQTEDHLRYLGVLQKPARQITPVALFVDPYCFEPPEYAVKFTA